MGSKKPARAIVLTTEEEQRKLLEEAKKKVNVEAFYMKRCLDNNKLMDALKHASNLVGTLRTGLLSPKNYYDLYILAFDQLRHLESYLSEEKKKGERMSKLYELVQYAGNILPRLYLLITVGSVYIKSKEAPAKDVLKDLVEMCRGVQHPTRGLFLRNYLSEMTKDKLPDTGSEYEGPGGAVKDSIDFIIQNFTEMNKLWVRMQHQGPVRDREKRESERQELRLLVGKNLARLSQLEGVDIDQYAKVVLPKIVEQIVNCKDQIAQQYLMECVTQVFPDDFHLHTLERILNTCCQLQPGVDVKSIVVALVNRLANYATRSPELLPKNIDIFEVFFKHTAKIIEARSKMPPEDVLALEVGLMTLSMKCYPDSRENVSKVLGHCAEILKSMQEKQVDITNSRAVKQIVKLLNIPLETYKNVLSVLELENYTALMPFLNYDTRKKVAVDFLKNAIENVTKIREAEHVNKFLEFISPLVKDETDQPKLDDSDMDDFREEQNLVASVVHLLDNDDVETLFLLYFTARKHFIQGQPQPNRIKHTLVPLIFRALQLAERIIGPNKEDEELIRKTKKVFKFIYDTINVLGKASLPDLTLRLFLQASRGANNCGFETIAYEFITQALIIYENDVTESKAQISTLTLIIASIQTMTCFSEENYDTLVTKNAQYSARLLPKPDQCRAIYTCSHLFWKPEHKDGKRVLECLQRSLKIADMCMDSSINVHLFVEILNQYLYYFFNKNEAITPTYLDSLVALITTNMANMESTENSALNSHFQNTLNYKNAITKSRE
eukprot:TRINITY_DN5417_c0_g1_i1.p1 TRINITY_DN5417_c0_g1~~TRINITY_DN5417_c0_g1_i1.p1  ORF type:complete len:782 (-),score=196.58 TRINITY_DN5417_c0_g1_i1:138-2483(-)